MPKDSPPYSRSLFEKQVEDYRKMALREIHNVHPVPSANALAIAVIALVETIQGLKEDLAKNLPEYDRIHLDVEMGKYYVVR